MSLPLVTAAERLHRRASRLRFGAPVSYVYAPLGYAWPIARAYLERYGQGPKEVVFVGMNPGPFGMAQTGVPFGEVALVRDWMKLEGTVKRPRREHPIVPVMVGDAALAGRMAATMLEKGVYVVGFSYPVVPQGKARIRTQVSAAHSPDELERAVRAFVETRREVAQ